MSLKEFKFKVEVKGTAKVYANNKKQAEELLRYTNVVVCGNKMLHPEVVNLGEEKK